LIEKNVYLDINQVDKLKLKSNLKKNIYSI